MTGSLEPVSGYKKVAHQVETFQERIYCDPPCGEELKVDSGRRGAVNTRYLHKCKNNHYTEIVDISYPRLVHREV